MVTMLDKSIKVSNETKKMLDKIKIISEEPYDKVIMRAILTSSLTKVR